MALFKIPNVQIQWLMSRALGSRTGQGCFRGIEIPRRCKRTLGMRENLPLGEGSMNLCGDLRLASGLRSAPQRDESVARKTLDECKNLAAASCTSAWCKPGANLVQAWSEDADVGMVLALLDIRRARAPYRPGTATGGGQQDAMPAPQRPSTECRDRSSLFQAATGVQPATDRVPRRSARLQMWSLWCASNRAELERELGSQGLRAPAASLPSCHVRRAR